MYASFGDLKLSPDRSEVFVSDPGDPAIAIQPLYNPGKIFIFDAATGEHKEDIPLAGLQDDSVGYPPDVWDLEFTPDGSALYAVTGHLGDRYGTVLKFDPRTRQFLGSLFPNIDHYFYGAAVGPRAQ
jgi:DNA-binding beta-propeller fold protein YncE